MRTLASIAALALLGVPGAALASQPSHPSTPANANADSHANGTSTTGTSSDASTHAQGARVLFVLRGTLGAYTAANGSTNGSVAITVERANHEAKLLDKQTLTFPVSSATKVVGTVTSGHEGIVKVRAARNASVTTLQASVAFQVIDQGASA